jgi:hypothetical protein
MKIVVKFIELSGRHFYLEISSDKLKAFNETSTKNKYLKIGEDRYTYVGLESDKIPVFKQVNIFELKIAQFGLKVIRADFKLGQALLKAVPTTDIDKIIKSIDIKRDPRIVQIRELTRDKFNERQKAHARVLFWSAKRDIFREEMAKAGVVKTSPELGQHQSLTSKVLEELQRRIDKAVRFYQDFSETKAEEIERKRKY